MDRPIALRGKGHRLAGEQVQVIAVSADGDTVSVHLERELDLALTPPGWTSSTTIVADARAQLRRAR